MSRVRPRRVSRARPRDHRTLQLVSKRPFRFDARKSSTQEIELAPRVDLSLRTARALLVVRVHEVSGLTATASCTVALRNAVVTEDDGVLIAGDALESVSIDDATTAPAVLFGEARNPTTTVALVLTWSQGSTAAAGEQDVVLSVDVVERYGLRRSAEGQTASRIAQRTRAREYAPGGVLLEVIPKRTFELVGRRFAPDELIPLAQHIDATQTRSLALIVRLHDASGWGGTESAVIAVHNESVDPDDPSVSFVDPEPIATVTIDPTSQAGELLIADTHKLTPVSSHVRVVLSYSPGDHENAVSMTLGVGLLARTHARDFVPTDIAGGILWLRSDLGVTLAGSNVSAWADQSGQGNDAAQGTTADQPAYLASGWSNGLPSIYFDRNNTEAMDLAGMADSSNDYTLFCALDQRNSSTMLQLLIASRITATRVFAAVADATADVGIFDGTWRNTTAAKGGRAVCHLDPRCDGRLVRVLPRRGEHRHRHLRRQLAAVGQREDRPPPHGHVHEPRRRGRGDHPVQPRPHRERGRTSGTYLAARSRRHRFAHRGLRVASRADRSGDGELGLS